jgi:biotin synthase
VAGGARCRRFLGDYLTSEGQPGSADLAMIADAGFTVEGAESATATPTTPPSAASAVHIRRRGPGTPPSAASAVHIRRRGPGTPHPANT